jgi:hypothetical protein
MASLPTTSNSRHHCIRASPIQRRERGRTLFSSRSSCLPPHTVSVCHFSSHHSPVSKFNTPFALSFFRFIDYKIESTNSSIDSFKTGRVSGDFTPFGVALVIDMGVFGKYGLTIDEMKRDNIPIAPELKHTTIDRLVQIANQYDFVVSDILVTYTLPQGDKG